MKFSVSLVSAALLACASARSLGVDLSETSLSVVKTRAADNTTSNALLDGVCNDVLLIFARGTDQGGNLGEMPAPDLVAQLNTALGAGTLGVQGVNYGAEVLTNILPGGCSPIEAAAMAQLITNATTSCPGTKLVVGGYSQGSAMVHASVSQLGATVASQVYAAVLFGDTQFQQTKGVIANFDPAKTLILCNSGDLVCNGTLIITDAHRNYLNVVPEAVTFIAGKVS